MKMETTGHQSQLLKIQLLLIAAALTGFFFISSGYPLMAQTKSDEMRALSSQLGVLRTPNPQFDWAKFVQETLESPSTPKFASDIEKARFVFGLVGETLANSNIPPNTDHSGRLQAGGAKGDRSVGTCEYCTKALFDAFRGAGFEEFRRFQVVGSVDGITGALPTVAGALLDPNVSHGALALILDGQIMIFDLWAHGRETGGFGNPAASPWNGRPFSEWAAALEKYKTFIWDNGLVRSVAGMDGGAEKPGCDAANFRERILRDYARGRERHAIIQARNEKAVASDPNSVPSILASMQKQKPAGPHWRLKEIRLGTPEEGYPPEFSHFWSGSHGVITARTDPMRWFTENGLERATALHYSFRWGVTPLAYLREKERMDIRGTVSVRSTGDPAPRQNITPGVVGYATLNGCGLFQKFRDDGSGKMLLELDEYGIMEATTFATVPDGADGQLITLSMVLGGMNCGMVVYTWEWVK